MFCYLNNSNNIFDPILNAQNLLLPEYDSIGLKDFMVNPKLKSDLL